MLLITCPLLKEGVALAQKEAGVFLLTLCLPALVHEQPSALPQALDALLAGREATGPLLLAGGWCGNSLAGYRPPLPLVVPKASDCLELLLFPEKKEKGVYYLSDAWLESDNSLLRQYQRACVKYGEKEASLLYRRIFAGYHSLCVLENPVLPPQRLEEALFLAQALRLELKRASASTLLLQKMLLGDWDEHFLILPAHEPAPAFSP